MFPGARGAAAAQPRRAATLRVAGAPRKAAASRQQGLTTLGNFMSSRVFILSMFGAGTYPSPLPKRANAPGGMVLSTSTTTLPVSIYSTFCVSFCSSIFPVLSLFMITSLVVVSAHQA